MGLPCIGAPVSAANLCAEFEALDQPRNLSLALLNLTSALLFVGDVAGARSAAERLPPVMRFGVEWGYECIALLFAQDGEFECSAQVIGYLDAWYSSHRRRTEPTVDRLARSAEQLVAAALGSAELVRCRAEGASLSVDQIRDRMTATLRKAAAR